MKFLFTILFVFLTMYAMAQIIPDDPDLMNDQQLEDLTEANESESEDDYDAQQVAAYKDHPLNINAAAESFEDFPFLEPLQVEDLLRYRRLAGDFISIYELQAVPGFSIDLIKKILPYIIMDGSAFSRRQFKERWKGGHKSVLIRPSLVPDNNQGFEKSDSAGTSQYRGGKLKLFFKYKYQYRDLLQYGVVGDKDAGEPLSFNGKQYGFDFNSFHLFIRKLGCIKSLAIGDYTINLGQGLIHWQSQAFKKTAAVINIKRQANLLRPYHSAGEYNFHRGLAVTVGFGKFETTAFISLRNLSAHINEDPEYGEVISSIQTSGYHRTETELSQKNIVKLTTIGGSLKWNFHGNHISVNGVRYHYSLPLFKRDEPYNLFTVKGNQWANFSIDYSYTFRNFHFFGEEAIDKNTNKAILNGVMATVDGSVDFAVLHRSISPAYQSIYGNAFTESSFPTNENGLYTGISWKLSDISRLDVYADLFSFPWLRYRTDAPGFGLQYLAQFNYKPNKKVEVYTRLRWRAKPLNMPVIPFHSSLINNPVYIDPSSDIDPSTDGRLNISNDRILVNWRTHVSYQLTRTLLLRTRLDLSWFSISGGDGPETGFLQYCDVVYKPARKWYSANFRLLVFETGGYDSRLYAYENDVPYSSSTPAFFGKGIRTSFNIKGNLPFKVFQVLAIQTALKLARTIYTDKSPPQSGSADPPLSHKSDIKIQFLLNFIQ